MGKKKHQKALKEALDTLVGDDPPWDIHDLVSWWIARRKHPWKKRKKRTNMARWCAYQ